MVDVSAKTPGVRTATAEARIRLGRTIMARLHDGELHGSKGPVFHTAIIAATQAVKQTSTLIPFCHPLPVEACEISITPDGEEEVVLRCRVTTTARTGVEMEAMTGAAVGALTLYDMTKALDKGIVIRHIRLLEKTGGKSGVFRAEKEVAP